MPYMTIDRYKMILEDIEKDYDLMEKQFKNSFLKGTGTEKEEKAKLDRMARLYMPSLKRLEKMLQYAYSVDENNNVHIKDEVYFLHYVDFLKKHPHLDLFKKAAHDGMKLHQAGMKSLQNVISAQVNAVTEEDYKQVEKDKNTIFMSNEDYTLTSDQRKGIAEFEKWLFRNCDKTGLKMMGGGVSKRDFANEFVNLPARMKLNALYILQNKKGLNELTDAEKDESQLTYVPDLKKIKGKIISNSLKVWERFSGEQFKWDAVQQAVQLSKQNEYEIKKYTFNKIDEKCDDPKTFMDNLVMDDEPKPFLNREAIETLESLNSKTTIDKDKLNDGTPVQNEIKIDEIADNGKKKTATNFGYASYGMTGVGILKSGVEFIVNYVNPIAEDTTKTLENIGTGISFVSGALTVISDRINYSNIKSRIEKMGEVIKKGAGTITKIAEKLKVDTKPKEFDGFEVIPSDEFENITEEQVKNFKGEDKELYQLGLAIKSQIDIAKQDYQEAKRHKSVAYKRMWLDAAKTGTVFISGGLPVTIAIGGIGFGLGKALDNENEELNREDYRRAFDKKVHTDLMVNKAKENIKERKKHIVTVGDEQDLDKYLADENAIKDKIRSEIVTENNFADVREWYRADKAGQVIQLINLKDKYKNTDKFINDTDDKLDKSVVNLAELEKENKPDKLDKETEDKINLIKALKKEIATNSEEMLDALDKSEESGKKQMEAREKVNIKELSDKSKANDKKTVPVGKENDKAEAVKDAKTTGKK